MVGDDGLVPVTEPAAGGDLGQDSTEAFTTYDERQPPPLDFEQWALASAAILERGEAERRQQLGARGIDPLAWDACNRFWIGELAGQLCVRDDTLARRYADICHAELAARARPTGPSAGVASDVDRTAFYDEAPVGQALPFVAGSGAAPHAPAAIEAHPKVGDTAIIEAPLFDQTLPFDEPDGGERGQGRG